VFQPTVGGGNQGGLGRIDCTGTEKMTTTKKGKEKIGEHTYKGIKIKSRSSHLADLTRVKKVKRGRNYVVSPVAEASRCWGEQP